MAEHLYTTLGVEKNATQDDIKKAYRRRARKTHPDKGGDKAEFQEVARAYAILSDESARARYDSTGDDDAPQLREDRLRSHVSSLFLGVLKECADIDHTDVVAVVRKRIEKGISANQAQIAELRQSLRRVERSRKRVRVRDGAKNFLVDAIDAQLRSLNQEIKMGEAIVDDQRQMLLLILDFSYETGPLEKQRTMFTSYYSAVEKP